jgi:hypothetical protein
MSKFSEMLNQARRGQSGSAIGFLGSQSKSEIKPRAAALVVEFPAVQVSGVEAALRAGVNGLLFTWTGPQSAASEALQEVGELVKRSDEHAAIGLHLTGGWQEMQRATLEQFKEQGVHYLVLPPQAPARLVSMHIKDLDVVLTLPLRPADYLYPLLLRNVSAFESVVALHLEQRELLPESLSIEEAMAYRSLHEATRLPVLLSLPELSGEAAGYGLLALGAQAVILPAAATIPATIGRIEMARETLEKIHQEERERFSSSPPTLPPASRSQSPLG